MTVDGSILHASEASFLVGRANPHRYSLFGNAELNASFRDRSFAMQLLRELLGEHLDTDVSGVDPSGRPAAVPHDRAGEQGASRCWR